MNKLAILRWPEKLEAAVSEEFKKLVEEALLDEKHCPARIVVTQIKVSIYIKPEASKRKAMKNMILKWHELLYDKYREQWFEPSKETTMSFLCDGTVYCGMFPDSAEIDEYGYFRFKIMGVFEV